MSYTIMTPNTVSSALQTLLFSNKQLEDALLRTSSMLRVADAKDNPGYWSTANAMTSDQSILESIGDALNLSESTIDTAYTAVSTVLEQLSELRSTLVTASDPGIDRTQLSISVESAKQSIRLAVESAEFSGTNWIKNASPDLTGTNSIVASFQRTANGAVTLTTQGIAKADTVLVDTHDASRGLLTGLIDASTLNTSSSPSPRNYYLLDAGSTVGVAGTEIAISETTTDAEIADMIAVVETLMASVTEIASRLGNMLNRVSSQSNFADALGKALKTSVSRLIDADMEEVSVRKTAAETQAQLAAETVSLANANAQKLLLLFG